MSSGVDLDRVWKELGTVMDPELGVPVTDLGLIYSVESADGTVRIVMTTTTPLCPLGAYLEKEIRRRLMRVSGVNEIVLELVHDPLWRPEMMNEAARGVLGSRFAPPRAARPTLTIQRSGR